MKTFALANIASAALASKLFKQQYLSQTGLANPTCLSTSTRAKAAVDDFYGILAGTAQYTDDDFSADSSSIYWPTLGEKTNLQTQNFKWKRAPTINSEFTLWGDGISDDDIMQTSLGACWAYAAASAIAEHKPDLIKKMFLNSDKALNTQGIYALTLYPLGVPHTVIVDDFLANDEEPGYMPQLGLSHQGADNSLWGPILEKAFAKYAGNYQHLEGGQMGPAIRMMTGAAYEFHSHPKMNADSLWTELITHEATNDILTVGTNGGNDT
jgi:hypothetical protein